MLLLLQRNLQLRVCGKCQATFLPPHSHQCWLQPQRSCRPQAMTVLSPFMAMPRLAAACVVRSLSLAIVEVWKLRVNFLNCNIIWNKFELTKNKSCKESTRRFHMLSIQRPQSSHTRCSDDVLYNERDPSRMLGYTQLLHLSSVPWSGTVLQSFLVSHAVDLYKDYRTVISQDVL